MPRGAIQRLDRTSAQLCRVEPADTAMGGSVTGPGPTDTGLSFSAAVVQAQLWLGVFMPRRHEPGSSPSTGALRGLVGAGPSQVGVVGALRARDVSRPQPDDVRAAQAKPPPIARRASQEPPR